MTRAKIRIAIACWFAAALACAAWAVRYGSTPGAAAATPARLPDLALEWRPDAIKIVQAIHPRCPCSRASLEALGEILHDRAADVDAVILIADYGDPSSRDSETVAQALQLQGARVVDDPDAQLALSLGMRTSGHTLAYAPDNTLLFSGGITISRGMRGPCPARELLLDAIKTGARPAPGASLPSSPVFGCALSDAGQCADGCGDQHQ